MEKSVKQFRGILYGALICLLVGFAFAASSPDRVFVGIGFIVFSVFLDLLAIIPAVKIIRMNKELSYHNKYYLGGMTVKNWSIKVKFIIAITLTTFISIAIISVFNYVSSRNILLNSSLESAYNGISSEADKIGNWVSKNEIIIETSGKILLNELYYNNDYSHMEDSLEEVALVNPDISSIYIGLSNDAGYFSDRWVPTPEDKWFASERDWYVAAMNNKNELIVIPPYIDISTDSTVITLAKYIGKTPDGLDMVCSADIMMGELLEIVSEINVAEGGYAFLADSQGRIMSHTVKSFAPVGEEFKNINDYIVYKQVQNEFLNGEKYVLVKDFDGIERYIIPFNVSQTGFSVYIAIPSSSIIGQLDSGIMVTVVITLIILLFTVLIIGYIASVIVINPISSIARATEKLAAGEFNLGLKAKYTDEIGKLRNDFGKVDDILSSVIKQINEMAKSHAEGNYEVMIDEAKFPGAYGEVAHGVNNMAKLYIDYFFDFINNMKNFGEGNFDVAARKYPGKLSVGNEAIAELRDNLKNVNGEINYIAQSAIKGKLDARVDTGKFNGGWKDIFVALNNVLEAVSEPISEVSAALSEISAGRMGSQMTGDYKGDFLNIENSLNSTSKSLSNYINDISQTLAKIAENDLSIKIDGEYIGDFIEIKNSINMIIDKFNKTLMEINIASEQINTGMRQISESSMNLAHGANIQMSAVTNLAKHIDKISDNAIEYNNTAQKAKNFSEGAIKNADLCSEKMSKMLNSMDSIKISVDSIDAIINLITDIAFQTNLLSLNASIEAARAGIHGKGFAVVAEEVGNLAKRSQEAANNSRRIIGDAITKVHEGSSMAGETSDSLKNIVESIGEVSNMVAGISQASMQQQELVKEISDNIQSISDVVTSNSSTSEEAASAAQELSSQAEVFSDSLSKFKFK